MSNTLKEKLEKRKTCDYIVSDDVLTEEEIADLHSITEDKGLFVRHDEDNGECYFDRVNFVDSNNRLVGYDLAQSCCEHADWRIVWVNDLLVPCEEKEHEGELDAKHTYREKVSTSEDDHWAKKVTHKIWFYPGIFFADERPEITEYEDGQGGEAKWRLLDSNKKHVGDLILENNHNGYYCHSFTDINNGELFECGSL